VTDPEPQANGTPPPPLDRRHRWDALGVVVASLVGLLALMVSGYTAWIQRQQVRAEVWPHVWMAYQDREHQLTVYNKGVGPAIVRSVRLTVDGKPQPDWDHAFAALGLPASGLGHSTLAGTVLSPGDAVAVMILPDGTSFGRFRNAMSKHGLLDICYCSTLGDCWTFEDRHPPTKPRVEPMGQCPRLPATEAFRD
jgi:hypothetical protein